MIYEVCAKKACVPEFERLPYSSRLRCRREKVKASYRDGVLTVNLPKAEEVKPRQIKIDIL